MTRFHSIRTVYLSPNSSYIINCENIFFVLYGPSDASGVMDMCSGSKAYLLSVIGTKPDKITYTLVSLGQIRLTTLITWSIRFMILG